MTITEEQLRLFSLNSEAIHPRLAHLEGANYSDHTPILQIVKLSPDVEFKEMVHNSLEPCLYQRNPPEGVRIPYINNPLSITETDGQYAKRIKVQADKIITAISEDNVEVVRLQEAPDSNNWGVFYEYIERGLKERDIDVAIPMGIRENSYPGKTQTKATIVNARRINCGNFVPDALNNQATKLEVEIEGHNLTLVNIHGKKKSLANVIRVDMEESFSRGLTYNIAGDFNIAPTAALPFDYGSADAPTHLNLTEDSKKNHPQRGYKHIAGFMVKGPNQDLEFPQQQVMTPNCFVVANGQYGIRGDELQRSPFGQRGNSGNRGRQNSHAQQKQTDRREERPNSRVQHLSAVQTLSQGKEGAYIPPHRR